jgi:hypothetical protein
MQPKPTQPDLLCLTPSLTRLVEDLVKVLDALLVFNLGDDLDVPMLE